MQPGLGPGCSDTILEENRSTDPEQGPGRAQNPRYFGCNPPKKGDGTRSQRLEITCQIPLRRGRNINRPAPQNFRRENRHFLLATTRHTPSELNLLPTNPNFQSEPQIHKPHLHPDFHAPLQAEERPPWCPAWPCHTVDPCATSQKQSCSPSLHRSTAGRRFDWRSTYASLHSN